MIAYIRGRYLEAFGEGFVGALAKRLQVSAPNISYHLKTLLSENLIMLEITDNKSRPVINKPVLKEHLRALEEDLGL